jgi:hypothetical protein
MTQRRIGELEEVNCSFEMQWIGKKESRSQEHVTIFVINMCPIDSRP